MAVIKPKKFPRGFLWGTAASAHEVEGNNVSSDWWDWEQKGGTQPSGSACDHYRRFEEDFKLAKSLNQNAHRFSIEWARIEPSEGRWDGEAVDHYHQVLSSLKKNDLTRFTSLFHVTLPLWFARRGGFENGENIKYFERFAGFCAVEFGEKVDFWVTVNEPGWYAIAAYGLGLWPPQKKSKLLALKVYLNLIRAHKKAYAVIKKEKPRARVGSALNMAAIHYHGGFPLLAFAAKLTEPIFNRSFLFLAKDFYDFIGVNYYFHHDISPGDLFARVDKKIVEQTILMERDDLGSVFYPKGIYEVLMKLRGYKKPIYITENGIADAEDRLRERFIKEHLLWAHQALRSGVDLRGYFYWSLMDNFEWTSGFRPRFGLVRVNYKTQKRIPRRSARFYAKVCKENAIPATALKT